MTTLALGAVLSEVSVVLAMTRCAVAGKLHDPCRLTMAVDTLEPVVCASQPEASLALVVELPEFPAIGGVTGGAIIAEPALVYIVLGMAAAAVSCCALECPRGMALTAADDGMHAKQRIVGQIVIEADVVLPLFDTMATVADQSEFAAVGVAGAMAAGAFLAELLGLCIRSVAGMAVEQRMCAFQSKLVLFNVIVFAWLPALVVMAGVAIFAEAQGVGVVSLVAAYALSRQLVFEVGLLVAGAAVNT